MLQVQTFTFNPLEENTYVLFDYTKHAAIIDPGCYEKAEENELRDFLSDAGLTVTHLINTHGHIDHVLGNAFVKRTYHVPLYIHPLEEPVLRAATAYAAMYGFPAYQPAQPDQWLAPGTDITIGHTRFQVLFLPGHAPGHIGLYQNESRVLISGDVLFHRSVGRTDLPGGDWGTLVQSIQQGVFSLPDEVVIYPGHGPTTTVGEEKQHNPFVGNAAIR
ncbi:MAG: MBL fold metallo-hydrolase [Cyclobacteriaceae bacterium]|jgi:glyoxylase-like metal-dependent hydrolase (beta-lactamase superfamily II)|nr:MBL fold metallo-hydrolase [Cyclobacteriaceae bacterium]